MKKIIQIIVIALMALGLAACADGTTAAEEGRLSSQSEAYESTTESESPVSEVVKLSERESFLKAAGDCYEIDKEELADSLLTNPQTAAETLLPLTGGVGEFTQYDYEGGVLEYTFSDESKVYLQMGKYKEFWYPLYSMDSVWEEFPDSKERNLEMLNQNKQKNRYLQNVTADTLREVEESAEDGSVKPEWYEKLEDRFIFLSRVKEADAALYALYGGSGLVLRVGNQVYPIQMYWTSPQMHLPILLAGDYDEDGQTEYAIKTHFKTGTGVSGDQLYIVEAGQDEYRIHTFEEYDRQRILDGIDYDYGESSHMLTVRQDNGRNVYMSLGKFLQDNGEDGKAAEFDRLVFGDIESFFLMDGKWFYMTKGGIVTKNISWPQYECSMQMICPVIYSETDGFGLGSMQFEPSYFYEQMHLAGQPAPQKVVKIWQSDLTHDGKKEDIVLSITCLEENRNSDYRKLLSMGETCKVRVYSRDIYEDWYGGYDLGKWPETDGYDIASALWESMDLAQAHAGNGSVFLVKKDGKDYILTSHAGLWQGVYEAGFRVLQINENFDFPYVVEEEEITVDFNSDRVEDIDETMDVEAMVAYTQKLQDWILDGKLLIQTDAEDECRIALNGNLKYDAWEIWKRAEQLVDEEVSTVTGAPKKVTLKDMASLQKALDSMRTRRLYWAGKIIEMQI